MWYFTKWWFKWRYKDLPFKMKNWTETQKSSCIEATLVQWDYISRKLDHNMVRLKMNDDKRPVLNNYTDVFGIKHLLTHPIFTQDEIANISRNSILQYFLLLLLITFEGIIYSQLLAGLIPREVRADYGWISLVAGLICSLLIVISLNKAIAYFNQYIEAKVVRENDNIPISKMKPFIVKRNIAFVIFIAFVLFSIYAGFMREKVLMGANADPETGKVVFIMSMSLSFLTAFVLALTEKDLHEKQIKYKVFKNWKKHHKERKEYLTELRTMDKRAETALSLNIEKYWSLVLDLQRIFVREYDETEEDLYKEYREEISKKTLDLDNIDPESYRKYEPIQSVSESLFKFGVKNNDRLVAKIEYIKKLVKELDARYQLDSKTEAPNTEELKKETHEEIPAVI